MRIRHLVWIIVAASVVSLAAATYVADEQIVINSTAVGFTASLITPNAGNSQQAVYAVCRLETAEIRYRISQNGLVPTSGGSGTLMEVGDVLPLQGHDVLAGFRAVRTTGTPGILDCTYSDTPIVGFFGVK